MANTGYIELPGREPSADIRARLAAEGKPVFLAFSRGKDSIATWLALREAGVEVIPYNMVRIPGMRFVEESLAYFEDYFGQHIIRTTHPWLYGALRNLVFQPPERIRVIDKANLPYFQFPEVVEQLRADFDMPKAWVCNGVRASDSPQRRLAIATHGPIKLSERKISAVWDWRKSHVMDRIAAEGIKLPVDYEWFGRSFDGLDRRFLEKIYAHAPDDWATILKWFPLAEMELWRGDLPD